MHDASKTRQRASTKAERRAQREAELAVRAVHALRLVMTPVAPVTKWLVQIILPADHLSEISEKWLFDNVKGFEAARGKLLARLNDPDKDGGIGAPLILRYLGKGIRSMTADRH
jgi:hypothetical protein